MVFRFYCKSGHFVINPLLHVQSLDLVSTPWFSTQVKSYVKSSYVKSGLSDVLNTANKTRNMHFLNLDGLLLKAYESS